TPPPHVANSNLSKLNVRLNQYTHEDKTQCASLGLFQIQSNGDVRTCSHMESVGNIKLATPREIWNTRPKWWEAGCCLENRMNTEEIERRLN
ncbi:MAG: SPASM domain-containing protein, partial [Pirellulales bacterium]